KLAEKRLEALQGLGIRAIADARTVDLAFQQPRVLQHLEVLRDGGLRERKPPHDVPANAPPAPPEQPEYGRPGGMTERLGEPRQLRIGRGGRLGPDFAFHRHEPSSFRSSYIANIRFKMPGCPAGFAREAKGPARPAPPRRERCAWC